MKKGLNRRRGILSLVFLYALVGISCQKEAVPVKSGFQKTHGLTITQNGVFEKKLDITGWEKNEDLVLLGDSYNVFTYSIYYPWQGEDSLDYRFDDGLLWVNGKLVGGDYLKIRRLKEYDPYGILVIRGSWGVRYSPITPPDVVIDIPSVDPEGVKRFPNLVMLHYDELKGDSSLKVLDSLSRDVKLFLECSDISNSGLKYLAEFDNIIWLRVNSPRLNSFGVKHLRKLRYLRWLFISAPVGNSGLKQLRDLKELQVLLYDSKISNRGLKHFRGVQNLKSLVITGAHVNDRGLRNLETLTGLRTLYLDKTNVTLAGVERLQKALPECKIKY